MLIDGGESTFGDTVARQLRRLGVLPATPGYVPCLTLLLSHAHSEHWEGVIRLLREPATRTVDVVDPETGEVTEEEESSCAERHRFRAIYWPAFDGGNRAVTVDGVRILVPVVKEPQPSVKECAETAMTVAGAFPVATKVITIGPGGLAPGAATPVESTLGRGAGDLDITVRVLAAAQGIREPVSGTFTPVVRHGDSVDQNDRPICILIEYGSFRFYAAGDIAGDGGEVGGNTGDNAADTSGSHSDVESLLGAAVIRRFPKTETPKANEAKFPAAGQVTLHTDRVQPVSGSRLSGRTRMEPSGW